MWGPGGPELEEHTSQIYRRTMWPDEGRGEGEGNRFRPERTTDFYSSGQQISSHGSIGDRKKHSQPESLDVARESRSRHREPERKVHYALEVPVDSFENACIAAK